MTKTQQKVQRAFNFSAGPSALPTSVLERVQAECLDWRAGMSVMEVSHRDRAFVDLVESIETRLRALLQIPDNYSVLFLQGGATSQFAMVPLNLLAGKSKAAYTNTGMWSKKAIAEAKRFCDVQVLADDQENGFTTIPDFSASDIDADCAYFHYTSNETINGVEFNDIPAVSSTLPLVADMSSNILSRPLDVSRFGIIYAGAQKNMGPAGITLVIVRNDLMGQASNTIPSMFDYALHAKSKSCLNTPPTFNWYVVGLVLEWLEQQGGLLAIEKHNIAKAKRLYDFIDSSDFYHNKVDPRFRSRMNVPFTLSEPSLESDFLTQANQAGLMNLEGHRSVGGMRASIYNAMSFEGIDALIDLMSKFEREQA